MKESLSHANLGTSGTQSTKTKVPRLNLNLHLGEIVEPKKASGRRTTNQSIDDGQAIILPRDQAVGKIVSQASKMRSPDSASNPYKR